MHTCEAEMGLDGACNGKDGTRIGPKWNQDGIKGWDRNVTKGNTGCNEQYCV